MDLDDSHYSTQELLQLLKISDNPEPSEQDIRQATQNMKRDVHVSEFVEDEEEEAILSFLKTVEYRLLLERREHEERKNKS